MDPAERAERHSRQLRLPWLGASGQVRLAQAKVLVVGCGGLGTPVIEQLAAAGVGHLHLVDDDHVERSNLNRQLLHRNQDIGRPKVERAAEWVRQLDPALRVETEHLRLGPQNARERVQPFDLVMDCTDGLPSKFLLNDACVLENKVLVHGAASGLQGQVLWMPGAAGPCLRCLFPELPEEGSVPNCQTAGVLASTCAWVGSCMALEAIFYLAGQKRESGRFLSVDAQLFSTRTLHITKRTDCEVCGQDPAIDGCTPEDYIAPTARRKDA